MSQPYTGEIRLFAGNFPPNGWATCDGQLLPINQYDTLFNLIGTTYGGDGQNTFALPNLAGRLPIHQGTSQGVPYVMGQTAGAETVTLISQQMPLHSHLILAESVAGNATSPSATVLAASAAGQYAAITANGFAFNANAVQSQGGNQPHTNIQPYCAVTYIISLYGVFPAP